MTAYWCIKCCSKWSWMTSSDQIEWTLVSPSHFIKCLRICKHKHYQFCSEGRQRTTAPLNLHVRCFSAQSARCQETTKGSGYKTQIFLENVITIFWPQSSTPCTSPDHPFVIAFYFCPFLVSLVMLFHELTWGTHRNMANLRGRKFSKPFLSVHFGGNNFIHKVVKSPPLSIHRTFHHPK